MIKNFQWFITMMQKFNFEHQNYVNLYYSNVIEIIDKSDKKQFVGNKERCRYCGSYNKNLESTKNKVKNGEISPNEVAPFKKIAHSLPTFIGNNSIISKDECDNCNEKFSDLENNLVSFLGVTRTTNKIKGRNGIPKSKINKHEFVDMTGNNLIIGSYENSDLYEETENTIIITTKKKFIPIKVYKCFVKMALSVLPLEKLKYFSRTIKWILGEVILNEQEIKQLVMWQTKWTIRNIFPSVTIDIYERKFDRIDIPFMFARVCFSNYAFQFLIPCCSMDLLVNNFNIPIIVKHEFQFKELVDDNILWNRIVHDTVVENINLSGSNLLEKTDRQYFHKNDMTSPLKIEELPDDIKKYLKDNKLIPE